MDIHIIRSSEVDRELFTKVFGLLEAVPGPIRFHCEQESLVDFDGEELEDWIVPDKEKFEKILVQESRPRIQEQYSYNRIFPLKRTSTSWATLFRKAESYRIAKSIPDDQFVLLITNIPNSNNWFASLDEKKPFNGFIHAEDWDHYIDCSASFPIAYEVVGLMLRRFLYSGYQELRDRVHEQPLGCVSDFCRDKKEIILKLRTADICPSCMKVLRERLDFTILKHARSIMESLRIKMLFAQNFRQDVSLSPLVITPQKKIFLTEFGNLEVKLRPLEKALYFLFLQHPEGLFLSNLCDHRDQLYTLYEQVSNSGTLEEMHQKIDNMTNVLSNSASEKISRIKNEFESLIGDELAAHYYIRGEVGQVKKIQLPGSLIIQQ
jgi:hypothetical protein